MDRQCERAQGPAKSKIKRQAYTKQDLNVVLDEINEEVTWCFLCIKNVTNINWYHTCTLSIIIVSLDYVICKYNDKVWVAFISSCDEEFDDFKDKFLYPSRYNTYYYYPEIEDTCHLDKKKNPENIGNSILKIRNSKDPILL